MRRPRTLTTPYRLRKPVSVAAPRTGGVCTLSVPVPVIARVRASLVLRVVRRTKPAARTYSDERGGR